MACVSSLAIGAFALSSWSNTLLHKFFFFKKRRQKTAEEIYKKDIVSAIIFYYMYSGTSTNGHLSTTATSL